MNRFEQHNFGTADIFNCHDDDDDDDDDTFIKVSKIVIAVYNH